MHEHDLGRVPLLVVEGRREGHGEADDEQPAREGGDPRQQPPGQLHEPGGVGKPLGERRHGMI